MNEIKYKKKKKANRNKIHNLNIEHNMRIS